MNSEKEDSIAKKLKLLEKFGLIEKNNGTQLKKEQLKVKRDLIDIQLPQAND